MRWCSPEQAGAAPGGCGQDVAGRGRTPLTDALPQGWPGVHVPQLLRGHLHRAGAKCKTDVHFTPPRGSLSAPISLTAFVGL